MGVVYRALDVRLSREVVHYSGDATSIAIVLPMRGKS